MKIELHPKAAEELQKLPETTKTEIKEKLQELKETPTGHENTDTIQVKGRTLFKYTIKEDGRGGKIDHRAVYDIKNRKIIIYTIFPRDHGYQKDDIARRF